MAYVVHWLPRRVCHPASLLVRLITRTVRRGNMCDLEITHGTSRQFADIGLGPSLSRGAQPVESSPCPPAAL